MHPEIQSIMDANREEITATARALEKAGYAVKYYGAAWLDGPLKGWYGIEMLAWDRSGSQGLVFRWPPTGHENRPEIILTSLTQKEA